MIASESEGPRNQTTVAYEAIRAGILTGAHAPEKKLKIQELAEALDLSPSAIREALSRLVPENLVVSRDQRGFIVAPLSASDLEDLTNLRCEIEAVALRQSLALGDVHWEAGILAAEHRLRSNALVRPDEDPRVAWTRNHASFHSALVSACGSPRLLGLHNQLYEQSERYRQLSFYVETDRDVGAEHSEIMQYALARDTESLVRVTVEHLRKTTALIVEAFARQPANA